ncbi:AAA family ATPase [Sphaerisporangium sp. NPDC049002]|uniref:ATP-binding protein n=1 Tax=unclassified Sphaerisporangium TaxID=2630420 RepID=UPI0033DA610C
MTAVGADGSTPARFGGLLRRLRLERGISLTDLSELVHYSKGYLSKVENDRKPLTPGLARECDRELRTGGLLARLTAERQPGDDSVSSAGEPAERASAHRHRSPGGPPANDPSLPEPGSVVANDPPFPEPGSVLVTGRSGTVRGDRTTAGSEIEPFPAMACLGREAELETLSTHAAAAAAGHFRVVWVGGEAGVGKSTIARALVETAERSGWQTAWGRCPEVDGAPPGWAWIEVMRRLRATGLAPEGGDGVGDHGVEARPPEERPVPDGTAPPEERPVPDRTAPPEEPPVPDHTARPEDAVAAAPFRLARELVRCLSQRAEQEPLLIVLDDVHRAGGETLQVLRHLFAELPEHPVLVVATYRPDEITADLVAARAAMAGTRAGRLDLGGLAEADTARLIHRHSGTMPARRTVQLIASRTGGNPLFVCEFARLIAATGTETTAQSVPDGVREVLRCRLTALPARVLSVLRTAAVIGVEADVDMLLMIEAIGEDAVLDDLETAVRAGLLTEPAPGTVRFSHVLVRDVLYEDIPLLRRNRLHARALEAFTRSRRAGAAVLAHHALAAATVSTARAAALAAADAAHAASALSAHQEAASLLERALQVLDLCGHGSPENSGEPNGQDGLRLDLLCALVSAQGHAGNVLAARASRRRAIEAARRAGTPEGLLRAHTAYDAPALWTVHEYQHMDTTLVEGLEALLATLPARHDRTRCRLLATLAIEVDANDPDRTDQASVEALTIARRLGEPALLCLALNARYIATTLDPDGHAEMERIGQDQIAVATQAGLTGYQAQGHQILFMVELGRNDLERAQWHVDQAVEHATTGQLGLALGVLAMFDALRDLIAGRFDHAERKYAEIAAQLRVVGDPNAHTFDLLVRFCLEHARADSDSGSQARMAALAEQSRPVYERLGDVIAEPYTRLLLAAGRYDQARAVWAPAAPVPRDFYWLLWTVFRAENAIHFNDDTVAATCYEQLIPHAGRLPEIVHGHITLNPVDHTLGQLATALGRRKDATRHYAEAINLAERIGAPHWAARSRHALTRLRLGSGAVRQI